jgi:hypothetical protein
MRERRVIHNSLASTAFFLRNADKDAAQAEIIDSVQNFFQPVDFNL